MPTGSHFNTTWNQPGKGSIRTPGLMLVPKVGLRLPRRTVSVEDELSTTGVLTGIVHALEIDVISVETTPAAALPLTLSPKPLTLPDVIKPWQSRPNPR
jgi:hypothetical protein